MSTDPGKRKHDRKQFFAEASLEFSSGKHQARISEISLGGCYVDSIASVTEGEPITIAISRNASDSQTFDGEIAYTLPGFGFGIRFTHLTQEHIDFLRQITS